MSPRARPCVCQECLTGDAPREIGGHTYELDAEENRELGLERWRYLCSCGSRGRWTYQSDNVPYHSWRWHVRRARRRAR